MGIKDYILSPKKRANLYKKGIERIEQDKNEIARREQLRIILGALPVPDKRYTPFLESVEKALYEYGYLGSEEDVVEAGYNKDFVIRITDQDIEVLKQLDTGIRQNKYKAETIRGKGANFIYAIEREMNYKNRKRTIEQIIEDQLGEER